MQWASEKPMSSARMTMMFGRGAATTCPAVSPNNPKPNTVRPMILLLVSMTLPSARQLAATAAARGWKVYALDQTNDIPVLGTRSFYGGTDRAAEYAKLYRLCLIEP